MKQNTNVCREFCFAVFEVMGGYWREMGEYVMLTRLEF